MIKKNILGVFITFLFYYTPLVAQENFQEIVSSKELENFQKEERVEELLKEHLTSKDSLNYVRDIIQYSNWLYNTNPKKAILYGEEIVFLRKTQIPFNPSLLSESLYNLGFYYNKTENHINSINAYKAHIRIKESKNVYVAHAHFYIGKNLRKIGDFQASLEYFEKSIQLYKKLKLYKYQYKALIESASIYQLLRDKKSIQNGIKNIEQAYALDSLINLTPYQRFTINQRLANFYNTDKAYDVNICIKYYKKALEIGIKSNKPIWMANTYNNIGNIYLHRKINVDSSIYFFKKAQTFPRKNKTAKARVFHNIGSYHMLKKEYQKAIYSFEKALDTLQLPINKNTDSFVESIAFKNKIEILYILKKYGNAVTKKHETFKLKQTDSLLKKSILFFKYADLLVDNIRLVNGDFQSKLFWKEHTFDLYSNMVRTYSLLNQPERAYYFMEKNKALLLLEDVTNEQLKRIANIPDNIIEREFSLKRKIAKTQNLLSKSSIDSLKTRLFDQKKNYGRFIDSLEITYPQYTSTMSKPNITSLNNVQLYADSNNSSFIQYIIDDEQGFGLLINKNKTELFQIENIENLRKDILSFGNLITSPFSSKKDREEYKTVSNNIYNALVPKHIRSYLTEKITIIPDYGLHNIPFEALFTSNNQYLIEHHEINYAYSISFLIQNKELIRTPEKEFLGFAPVQYSGKLATLSNSKIEVNQVSTGFDSTILSNDKATKQNLIDHLSNYEVIHLSTHANANDSITPWIASTKEKITLNDIYATKNNAELVVLSACNTSIGSIKKGEGVMSLARGFFNTGANSVISTLWKADDQSTLELTTDFYKFLKKGMSKSEALRKTKLNYLTNHSLSEASPYYWSSLILIGDPDPLPSISRFNIWMFILGFIPLTFLIILFFYKKRVNNFFFWVTEYFFLNFFM
ncbi:CHAT domain-containing protein [Aquimarina sp. 2201CG14-23]|uniref:CHAT domain-containing protein n=1 Tax=Aquimarina mycalae TaxID=3040073 RepID=UPI002477FA5F|nr:CHAT domain-containing tetratricopeptide repeat protein [Aquimarina sp. 2201CG14-23]MDH7445037.1 CHAT domain-containing protein [Aquimarina sp. 2201CG14-23]